MDKNSTEAITALTDYIERFQSLRESEQTWLAELLTHGKLVKTVLNVLDSIEYEAKTYQEIADECELHPNTVKQIIYALIYGGFDIYEQKTGKYICPVKGGRPRELRRLR